MFGSQIGPHQTWRGARFLPPLCPSHRLLQEGKNRPGHPGKQPRLSVPWSHFSILLTPDDARSPDRTTGGGTTGRAGLSRSGSAAAGSTATGPRNPVSPPAPPDATPSRTGTLRPSALSAILQLYLGNRQRRPAPQERLSRRRFKLHLHNRPSRKRLDCP